jgi:hypothetical protein
MNIKEIGDGLATLAAKFPEAKVTVYNNVICVVLPEGSLELAAMESVDMFEGGPTTLTPIDDGEEFEMPRGWHVDGGTEDPTFSYQVGD